jgi:hypothetical protein
MGQQSAEGMFCEDKYLTFRIEPRREITLFAAHCDFKVFGDGKVESVIAQSPNLSDRRGASNLAADG